MVLGAVLVLSVANGPARAQTPETTRQGFDVPAGGLEDALNAFARQAGITLSFDPALVRGREVPALEGSRTVAEGLAELLAGHSLEALRSGSGAYSVQRATASSGSHDQLPAVTVTAQAERGDGPVLGYVAQRSAIATGIDTPLIATPRAVTVVTRDQMDDQAVQTAEQSLRYSAGVLTEVAGHDLRFASLTVRGFAPDEFLDGSRLFASNVYSGWLIDPQGLERIELLKGPAAALYDQASPGGVVNMVSKRPTAEAVRELGLAVGSYGRTEGSFDLGGALNPDGSLMYRLNGLLRASASQTDFAHDDRTFIAPSLTWKPSSRTTLTVLADATRDRMTPKSAWPEGALLVPNPNGPIPVRRAIGEPGLDRFDRRTASLGFLLEHRIDERWTLRQNARYSYFGLDYLQVYGSAFASDMRTLDRLATTLRDKTTTLMLDNQLARELRTGPVAHTLLMGADYRRYASDRTITDGAPAPPIDAFAPVYGAPLALPPFGFGRGSDRLDQLGLYAQDQMRWGRWSLGLGGRAQALGRTGRTRTHALPSHNAGLLYESPSGLSPYLSYSTSFRPVAGSDFLTGEPYKPELGRQFELGLKYRPPGMNALFTLSAFDLRKRNAWTQDPNQFSFTFDSGERVSFGIPSQTGEVRTRGVELEARAALTRQLKLVGAYTLLDAMVTRSEDPQELGRRPPRTARISAAVWLDYRFGGSALQGWSVGGGLRHVGAVPANIDNSRYNPPYTLVDAAVRYERGPYTWALNASNLFDKAYVAGSGQFFGQARTLQAKLTYRW